MKRLWFSFVLHLTLSFFVAPIASAHTPIAAGSNESLESATVIPDPTKSWAIYTELHESNEAQYFKFDAAKGDRIPISLYTSPAQEEADFSPNFVLMGPGITNQGAVPTYIDVPADSGQLLKSGERPAQATYEAFAPGSFVEVAMLSFEAPVEGTYYVAVFDEDRGGRYGVAIGSRETSTLYEWITNPLVFPSIYAWEGQNLLFVYIPAFFAVVLGIFILNRSSHKLDIAGWIATIAGLLSIASGVTVASQMIVSLLQTSADGFAIVTLFLAVIPMLLGMLIIRLAAHSAGNWMLRSRLNLVLLGVLALFCWSGWIVGPVLAVIAALVPASVTVKPASQVAV